MDNLNEKIVELLSDESFLKYCNGDQEEKNYWERKFEKNTDLKKNADEARKLYGLIKAELENVPQQTEKFRSLIYKQSTGRNIEAEVIKMPRQNYRWLWAAAIMFIVAVPSFLLLNKN